MRAWEYGVPLGSKLCVAEGVFELDILWIVLSEFHKTQKQTRLYMARRTCFREQYYTGTRRYYVGKKIMLKISLRGPGSGAPAGRSAFSTLLVSVIACSCIYVCIYTCARLQDTFVYVWMFGRSVYACIMYDRTTCVQFYFHCAAQRCGACVCVSLF